MSSAAPASRDEDTNSFEGRRRGQKSRSIADAEVVETSSWAISRVSRSASGAQARYERDKEERLAPAVLGQALEAARRPPRNRANGEDEARVFAQAQLMPASGALRGNVAEDAANGNTMSELCHGQSRSRGRAGVVVGRDRANVAWSCEPRNLTSGEEGNGLAP